MPRKSSSVSAGPLAFSHSKKSLYEECPLKYKFRYVDKLPEEPKPYFAFGTAIHSALDFLYRVSKPPFPAKESLLAYFKQEWDKTTPQQKGYRVAEKANDDFLEGLKMLSAYYDRHYPTLHIPFATEFKTKHLIDNLDVIIIVDRIDYLPDGTIGIVDYKTGKTLQREPDQLHMYQKIVESSPEVRELVASKAGTAVKDIKVGRLSFYHVPSQKEDVFERASDREIGEFWEKVLSVAENIRAAKFEPAPGEKKCFFCDYKKLCPVYAGAKESRSDMFESLSPVPPQDMLAGKAERYIQLVSRMKELGTEMESLKNDISAIMTERGLADYSNGNVRLVRHNTIRFEGPDRAKAVEFLKSRGLVKKALTLTQKTVAGLLDDPSVPEDAKKQLKKLARQSVDIKLEKAV